MLQASCTPAIMWLLYDLLLQRPTRSSFCHQTMLLRPQAVNCPFFPRDPTDFSNMKPEHLPSSTASLWFRKALQLGCQSLCQRDRASSSWHQHQSISKAHVPQFSAVRKCGRWSVASACEAATQPRPGGQLSFRVAVLLGTSDWVSALKATAVIMTHSSINGRGGFMEAQQFLRLH